MKRIGFKNFRRFTELEPLELGEITILVGKNNSGKSTLVKAILLVLDYLKNQQGETFSFASEVLNDANIVTFDRAKCKFSNEPFINFQFEIENYKIEINISGEGNYTYADVNHLQIVDARQNLVLKINYAQQSVSLRKMISKIKEPYPPEKAYKTILEKRIYLNKQLETISKTSPEGLEIINQINSLNKKIHGIEEIEKNLQEQDQEYFIEYSLKDLSEKYTEGSILEEIVSDLLAKNNDRRIHFIGKREDTSQLSKKENEEFDNINSIEGEKNKIQKSISTLVQIVHNKNVYYLGANPSKQSALFNLRVKENALAQAIHKFYQLKTWKGSLEYQFVEKWMSEFDIGKSFQIEFIAGEAYEFYVENEKGKIHLADMGMGSLQLMLLILRIATLIGKFEKSTKGINLIVEEPELNLHPALQSKLADFFYTVNDKYGIKFIVETHSEYIVRKSQVIGLEEDLFSKQESNPNPFKVYYFHMDEGPYEMPYDEKGKFIKEFGTGFTDVSRKLTRKLL